MDPTDSNSPVSLRGLRVLAAVQVAVGVLGTAATGAFGDLYQAASFGAGVALILFNLLLLAWSWWRLIEQKSIAWTVLIIVIKYAVLLSSIFYLARSSWFRMVSAGLGIASFVIAALVWAVTSQEKEKT